MADAQAHVQRETEIQEGVLLASAVLRDLEYRILLGAAFDVVVDDDHANGLGNCETAAAGAAFAPNVVDAVVVALVAQMETWGKCHFPRVGCQYCH